MKIRALVLAALTTALFAGLCLPAAASAEVYELRIYHAHEGKMDDLNARFRNHTIKLFEKQGMKVVGFWQPIEDEDGVKKLYYILGYPSVEDRGKMWKAFGSDPEWQKVYKDSQKNGKLVAKVESIMMNPTDYSPIK